MKKYVFLIIVASLAFRFAYLIISSDSSKYFWWKDSIHYSTAAENLAEDGTFGKNPEEADRPFSLEPIYPIFLAGIVSIFGKSFLAIRLIQGAIFAFSGVAICLILKRLTSKLISLE